MRPDDINTAKLALGQYTRLLELYDACDSLMVSVRTATSSHDFIGLDADLQAEAAAIARHQIRRGLNATKDALANLGVDVSKLRSPKLND